MFYTLIKRGFLTNQSARKVLLLILILSLLILLIICMKKFEMVKQKKRTRITQSGKNCIIKLRHPRRAVDLKAKDLIGYFKNRIVY